MAILLTEQVGAGQDPGEQQDELVRFLEQNPAYYTVMKSGLCIRILESLSQKAKNLLMLRQGFPRMEQQDIMVLLETLADVGVVSHLDAGSNRFFYTNEKGKRFLEIYRKTREKFLGKEEGF